ncbi:hypothetical protein ORL59_28385 [Bacillus cereus]|uniref:hypothetical protein n=1 Tax=Bacillus cereus TaxID=1396 RepID=UPI002AC1FF9C|nr:hypothetical protein [Bacillus cereus]MDZ4417407.1 hypothetical protein [Bacillus cereus]
MAKYNYFTYAIMNTIIFLPYFLFIIIGNSYNTILNGWFPLIIFYTFKYTGAFLINSFRKKINTRELLLGFLILAIIGTMCGAFAPFSAIWIELSALFMGIASSILLPLYTTTQYHEKCLFGTRMKLNHYLLALLTVMVIVPLILFTANSNHPSLAFIFYGIAFSICYISLRAMPKYQMSMVQFSHFSLSSFTLFILFTVLLFVMKATRETDFQILIAFLLISILTTVAALALLITKLKFRLQLPKYIYYFSFTQGMIVNFYLLYGTFFALSQKNNTFMIYGIYLPYGLGIISSLFIGNKIIYYFNRYHPLTVINVACFLGIFFTTIPWTLSIGGLFVGFFSSLQARKLNRLAYDATDSFKDSSLLLRNRWSKLGSMINQSCLVFFILLNSHINHIPVNQVFLTLTGKTASNQTPMFITLIVTAILIMFLIGGLLLFGSRKLEQINRHKM